MNHGVESPHGGTSPIKTHWENQLNNQLEVRTTSTFFTLQEVSQQNSEKGPPNYITETLGPRLLNHC